jgi:hypothetical protein
MPKSIISTPCSNHTERIKRTCSRSDKRTNDKFYVSKTSINESLVFANEVKLLKVIFIFVKCLAIASVIREFRTFLSEL